MKITAIHETVAPISSDIRNAYIDFSKMTASVVAVVTDVKRNGKRVVGYGFNSNGRYAQSGLVTRAVHSAHHGRRGKIAAQRRG